MLVLKKQTLGMFIRGVMCEHMFNFVIIFHHLVTAWKGIELCILLDRTLWRREFSCWNAVIKHCWNALSNPIDFDEEDVLDDDGEEEREAAVFFVSNYVYSSSVVLLKIKRVLPCLLVSILCYGNQERRLIGWFLLNIDRKSVV